MIEIKDIPKSMASSSARLLKIESIVKAWYKIENDPEYAESQKDLVSRTSIARIYEIMTEGMDDEYQRIDL